MVEDLEQKSLMQSYENESLPKKIYYYNVYNGQSTIEVILQNIDGKLVYSSTNYQAAGRGRAMRYNDPRAQKVIKGDYCESIEHGDILTENHMMYLRENWASMHEEVP